MCFLLVKIKCTEQYIDIKNQPFDSSVTNSLADKNSNVYMLDSYMIMIV